MPMKTEASIIVGDRLIDCGKRAVGCRIGGGCTIMSNGGRLPKGTRFVIGENPRLDR